MLQFVVMSISSSPDVIVVGAIVLAVYLPTVAPGIAGGDAGELVAESCHLGTAHPPGYPLFTILNHVTTRALPGLLDAVWLRPGPGIDGRASPAWCANATAAVMGALAAVFTTQTASLLCVRVGGGGCPSWRASVASNRWDDDRVSRALASGCAGTLMAFSPLMWQYSVTAEVFALNNCLLSILCYLFACFALRHEFVYAAWGALISGLALSNQHTAVLYVAPLSAWVMFQLLIGRCRIHTRPWPRRATKTLALAGLFLVGLSPYAYLPIAARHAPRPGSWGDVATWDGFWHHLRRGDYGSLRLYSGRTGGGGQGLVERLWRWGTNFTSVQGLNGIVLVLAVLGVLATCVPSPLSSSLPAALNIHQYSSESEISGSTNSENSYAKDSPPRYSLSKICPPVSSSHTTGETEKQQAKRCTDGGGTPPTTVTHTKSTASSLLESCGIQACGVGGGGIERNDDEVETSAVGTNLGKFGRVLMLEDKEGSNSAPMALLAALVMYLVVFHWLSNMPLDDPLLFGVHARFWMQPNTLVFVFCGVGIYRAVTIIR